MTEKQAQAATPSAALTSSSGSLRYPLETPAARTARFDPVASRIEIELTDGRLYAFPAHWGQGLVDASAEDLADIEVLPEGFALHWPRLNASLAVAPLLEGHYGSRSWTAQLMGQVGGRARSEAKAAAARLNGRKGGRPRKASPQDSPEG
ncbi:MAG: DUF2442 domain-containing protein [Candidatus Sericytochromatia bacterium]|nr:DUF2442 domain-containing protein [Candidatus Sericytochromatia bacterium]